MPFRLSDGINVGGMSDHELLSTHLHLPFVVKEVRLEFDQLLEVTKIELSLRLKLDHIFEVRK